MNIMLREWNRNVVLGKFLVDEKTQIRFYVLHIKGIIGPEKELKIQGGIAKIVETDKRFGDFCYQTVIFGTCHQDLLNFLNITSISHTNIHMKAGEFLNVAPVDNIPIDEFRVGDDEDDIIPGFNFGGAKPNFFYFTNLTIQFHHIIHLQVSLEEHEKPGYD